MRKRNKFLKTLLLFPFVFIEFILRKCVPPYRNLPLLFQRTISALLIFTILALNFNFLNILFVPKAQAAWYDDSWTYRKAITVTVTTNASDITNLQTLLTVDANALGSSKLQTNCQDLRFTNANGKRLDYYIDTCTNSTAASKVWVMLDLVPKNTTTYTVYMYYGNPTAAAGTSSAKFDNVVGLKAYWTFNEGSGSSVADSSTTTATGTWNGTGTTWAAGVYDDAASFNGSDNYLGFGSLPAMTSMPITIEMWANPNTTTPTGMFDSAPGQTNVLRNYSGGYVEWWNQQPTVLLGLSASTWQHLTFVYEHDGTNRTLKYYKNGVLQATGSNVNNSTFAWTTFRLGNINGGNWYSGLLDDVKVYNTARTAAQVAADYTNTSCGGQTCNIATAAVGTITPSTSFASEEKGTSPVGYWKFDDGTGTTAQDSSQNNNDGTLSGSTLPTWQTEDQCISGKCLYLDGSNSYIAATAAEARTNVVSAFTWIRPTTVSTRKDLISSGNALAFSTNNWILSIKGNAGSNGGLEVLGYNAGGATTVLDTAGSLLSVNQWYQVGFTSDGTTVKIFINGVQVASGALVLGTASTQGETIGASNSSGTIVNKYGGHIDEPKIYNFALTAAQIKANYVAKTAEGGSNLSSSSLTGGSISNGLAGYWKMDEAAWTANCSTASVLDSSGNANNGKSCPTTTGPAGGAAGKFGNAGSFDGSDDYVITATSTFLNTQADWTISAWVKTDTAAAAEKLVAATDGNFTGLIMQNSKICAADWSNGNTNQVIVCEATGDITSWHHYVSRYIGNSSTGTLYLFKDGALEGSSAITTTSLRANFYIGGYPSGSNFRFTGKIDEVRVYNRALSPNEVSQLYNFAPGPVGYWNFEEGSGTSTVDKSGNGNTGTLTNGPTWISGKYGKGLKFDGSNDYVTIGNPSNLNFGDGVNYTISFWIQTNSSTNTGDVIAKAGAGDQRIHFYRTGGIQYRWSAFAGPATSPSDGWTYITYTYVSTGTNTGVETFYNNGVSSTTRTGSVPAWDSSTSWSFGAGGGGGFPLNAALDDIKIYNYARTAGQIIEDMNAGNPAPGSPVGSSVAYWKMDQGYGTTAEDSSINNNDLTLSSASWTQSGKFDKAWNGTGALWLSRADDADLDFAAADDFSTSLWFKSDSATNPGATEYLVNKASATIAGYAVYANTSGNICFGIDDDTVWTPDDTACSTTDIYDSTWHYITATKIGTTEIRLYVDGVSVASDTSISATATLANSLLLYVGDRDGVDNGDEFNGDLDEVKIYRSALTADAVKLEKNQGQAQVLGSLSDNSTYEKNASNQEYCVPGDSTSCAAPVGRWDMNEGTGTTTYDSSGNGYSGTLNSSPVWTTGKYGKGIEFNSSLDQVSTVITPINQNSGTLSMWIYPKSFSGTNPTLYDVGGYYWLRFNSNTGTLLWGGGNSSALTGSTLTANAWYHIEVTWGSVERKIYVNGVQVAADTTAANNVPSGSIAGIGNNNSSIYPYTGVIDNLRIFNYARSVAQVAWDYNKGGPVGHWRFDECQGTVANDNSGNSNTGTITVGATGTYTSAGTCSSGTSTHAWAGGVAGAGKRNYALSFDGTDDYVTMGDVSTFDFTDSFTISTWIKTTQSLGAANYGAIMGKCHLTGACNGYGFYLDGDNSNKITFQVRNSATIVGVKSTNALNDGNWHHIVGVREHGTNTSRIYVDGILNNSDSSTSFTNYSSAIYFGLGRRETNGSGSWAYPFSGQIDDARIYNYALTATQVKTLKNQGTANYSPVTGAP